MQKKEGNITITVDDYAQGFHFDVSTNTYKCLICNAEYSDLEVYPVDEKYLSAKGAMLKHITDAHGSVPIAMTSIDRQYVGLSESLHQYAQLLAKGYTDEEISDTLKLHPSTLRNYRHKLREKTRQAKMLLALSRSIGLQPLPSTPIHANAKQVDDRYDFTDKEANTVIANYFTASGELTTIPSKAKKKIICLQHIAKNFKLGRIYREVEVNTVLQRIYEDHVSIRRALIEYGLMTRTSDGASYTRK